MYGDRSEMIVLTCHTLRVGQIIRNFFVLLLKLPHATM